MLTEAINACQAERTVQEHEETIAQLKQRLDMANEALEARRKIESLKETTDDSILDDLLGQQACIPPQPSALADDVRHVPPALPVRWPCPLPLRIAELDEEESDLSGEEGSSGEEDEVILLHQRKRKMFETSSATSIRGTCKQFNLPSLSDSGTNISS